MKHIPNRSEILERLRRVVPEKVDVDPARMRPEAVLGEIGVDSFALIELVFIAEEEFDIRIPIEGLEVKTVSDVLDVIGERIIASAA